MIVAEVVEGETARIVFPIIEDGAALVGTGFTVSDLVIVDRNGVAVDTANDFGWVDEDEGTVYFDPDAGDFQAHRSPYRVRIKLLDASAKVRYYPNKKDEKAEIWVSAV